MYSIFLVDDEHIELEMMRDFIRWEDMGIYVAGTAANGKEALEKIRVIQPDIILTDVKMPIMNGIELATQVSEEFNWIKVVFLTGYDEFDYVKSALNVGAVGYILKPLDLEEIAGAMERVKHKCEEVRMNNRSIQVTKMNIIKELIYEKKPERRTNLLSSYDRLEQSGHNTAVTLVLCSVDPEPLQKHDVPIEDSATSLEEFINQYCEEHGAKATLISNTEGECCLLLGADEQQMHRKVWGGLSDAVNQRFHFTVTIMVSERYDTLDNLHLLYDDVKKLTNERYYVGSGHVIYLGDVEGNFNSKEMPPFSENELFDAVLQNQFERAASYLQEYFSSLVYLRIYKKHVCSWAINLTDQLDKQMNNLGMDIYKQIESRADLYDFIYGCELIIDVEAKLIQVVQQTIELMMNRSTDKNAKIVSQLATLIQNTYHEQITISSLSSQVYLSPNYLRSIFKENTGVTIHEYITKVRLEKAREMLSDPSLRIHDIALKVGYESASYFCSLFLKSQGVTPNEYRKNLQ